MVAEITCPVCFQFFDKGLEPVIFAVCNECNVVYCRPCLTMCLAHASMCPHCRKKFVVTRRTQPIGCGLQRLAELRGKAVEEANVVHQIPESGELAMAAVSQEWLETRRREDNDEESEACARRLADDPGGGGPADLDEASRNLIIQLEEEQKRADEASLRLAEQLEEEAEQERVAEERRAEEDRQLAERLDREFQEEQSATKKRRDSLRFTARKKPRIGKRTSA